MTEPAYTAAVSKWSEDIPDCWWACPYDQEPGPKTRPNDFVRRIYCQRPGPFDWRTYCLNYSNRRYILDVVEWDPNSPGEQQAAEWEASALIPELRPGIGTKWPVAATPQLVQAKANQNMQTELKEWELFVPEIVGQLTGEMPPTTPWPKRWSALGASPRRIRTQLLPQLARRRGRRSESTSHAHAHAHAVEPSVTRDGLWEARLVWPNGARLRFFGPDRAEVAERLASSVQALDASAAGVGRDR